MPTAVRVSPPVTDNNPLASIALFSGVGLLVSLVAILLGLPGVWH